MRFFVSAILVALAAIGTPPASARIGFRTRLSCLADLVVNTKKFFAGNPAVNKPFLVDVNEPLPEALKVGQGKMAKLDALARRLRNQADFDPRQTHVPEFAADIPGFMDFVRKALLEQAGSHLEQRLGILENFEREANVRQAEHRVTYEWWNDFHFRLAMLLSEKNPLRSRLSGLNDPGLGTFGQLLVSKAWLDPSKFRLVADQHIAEHGGKNKIDIATGDPSRHFPRSVYIPTWDEIGIIAMNESDGEAAVVGTVPDITAGDGKEFPPDDYVFHDRFHGSAEADAKAGHEEEFAKARAYYWVYRENVKPERRAAFELAFFYVTHENPQLLRKLLVGETELIENWANPNKETGFRSAIKNPKYFAGVIPIWTSGSPAALQVFTEQVRDEILKFFAQMKTWDGNKSETRL